MKANLRKKKIKNGKESLYLDFYPPIIHPVTGKPTRREFLKLHLFEKPKSELERLHNRETKALAENIRAKRQISIQNHEYDFLAADNRKKSFLTFFKEALEVREEEKRNYQAWKSTYLYLYRFTEGHLTFGQTNEEFCKKFKKYLLDTHLLKSKKQLSQNAASSYFNIFKEAVKKAFEENYLRVNPILKVKSIKAQDSDRTFLTFEELQLMSATDCELPMLKEMALFSALTGLRWSDVHKLKWEEVEHSEQSGYFLNFKIKKTNAPDILPISEQAYRLMGEQKAPDQRVFKGLNYGTRITTYLNKWAMTSGVKKTITFHSFRHSFATLQLTYGTDIYTISKLLGHKNLQTTQIYAHLIDKKKQEAVDRIPKLDL